MAAELRDLRTKVTAAADVALEARARVEGKDKAEVAREVLHAWGVQQLEFARLAARLAHVEGLPGAAEGTKR